MLHWVHRLDGFGVPSPINPRDPTTFIKNCQARSLTRNIYQEIVTREADQRDEDSAVCQSENKEVTADKEKLNVKIVTEIESSRRRILRIKT